MSKFQEYLESAKNKMGYSDSKVKKAMNDFAADLAEAGVKDADDDKANKIYKKYADVFDNLSDSDHNKVMDVVWNELVPDYMD